MMRTLHHPDLDVTIRRHPRQAKTLAESGWVDVTDDSEPARNGSTEEWQEHLTESGMAFEPDAGRDDLIALWDNRA